MAYTLNGVTYATGTTSTPGNAISSSTPVQSYPTFSTGTVANPSSTGRMATPQELANIKASTITSSSLQPTSPIILPTPIPTADYSSVVNTATGMAITTPPNATPEEKSRADLFKAYSSSIKEAPNTADIYKQLESDAGLRAKEASVQNLKNQLGAITARANADILAARNQSSQQGGTVGILSARENEISRTSAIQTLPLQAQLAAEQGDLATAQAHVDKLFQIYATDAQNKVDYWNKQAEAVYKYLDKEQQRVMDNKKAELATNTNLINDERNQTQAYASSLLSTNPALSRQLQELIPPNPLSKTLSEDLIKYKKQVGDIIARVTPKASTTAFSFTPEDKQLLVGANFKGSDLENIKNDINTLGIDAVLANPDANGKGVPFTDAQKSALKQVLNKGNTPDTKPFLTEDFFKTSYGEKALQDAAYAGGFTTGGFLGMGKSGDTTAYLADLMKKVQTYRDAGYTDKQILDLMK